MPGETWREAVLKTDFVPYGFIWHDTVRHRAARELLTSATCCTQTMGDQRSAPVARKPLAFSLNVPVTLNFDLGNRRMYAIQTVQQRNRSERQLEIDA
ncbi:hypothetical protein C0995_001029 [Termitomyces sp. Mi166|nr:hypothetical protein C0995_001029 [Termitomyces sp. Mi166\